MNNKIKLGIMTIVIIAVIGGGVAVILLSHASAVTLNMARQQTTYMTYQYAQVWGSKIDGYIKVLQSVSNVMNSSENLPFETRRRIYENTMETVLEDTPEIVKIFTVWEPNAKTVEIADPTVINLDGRDRWCLSIMVPILNKRLGEPVGVVGCLVDIELFQLLVERAIRDNEEIYKMALYTNTGFILANYLPEMIGKRLADVGTQYGEYLDMVVGAVENARECELSSYDPDLQINMIMSIVPIPLAGTSTTWSLMIGSGESYILRDVNAMKRFVVFLLVIAIMGASVLVYLVINRADKPNA